MGELFDSKRNPKKNLKGELHLKGKMSFELAVLITFSFTIYIVFNISSIQINICTGFLGSTIFCNYSTSPDPVPPQPTVLPTSNECTRFGPYIAESDKVRVTVTSILIEQINVDINRLKLSVTVENMTNSNINLDLYSSTRVMDASNNKIIDAPDMTKSTWDGYVAANSKETWIIALDRISVHVPYLSLSFLDLGVNGKLEPAGLIIEKIRSSCSSDN